jgi:hypothetical protein
MKYTFKSKEQVYNGVKFRSTLEARWAIFFDACGLDWVYEPECFELDTGNYTPDFYLKKYDLFVEIKPNLDWYDNDYDFYRYTECPKRLLVLSVPFPSISQVSACFSEKIELYNEFTVNHRDEMYYHVNFCPNHKHEPFYFSGYNLGDNVDIWKNEYKNEINVVKKHRFF